MPRKWEQSSQADSNTMMGTMGTSPDTKTFVLATAGFPRQLQDRVVAQRSTPDSTNSGRESKVPAHDIPPLTEGAAVFQIQTRYDDAAILQAFSYKNAKKRNRCHDPWLKSKLMHSCAGPNPGAINYIQFTTDIVLEVNERCKRLALENTTNPTNSGPPGPAMSVVTPRPPAKRQGT